MKKNISGVHILLSAYSVNRMSAEELARIAVEGGASVVQLREKQMPMAELLPLAKKLRKICEDITFIVNDRADLAKIIEADGVHLGQDDLSIEIARELLGYESLIGISCGTTDEAIIAERNSANYIGFGHMYPTTSKLKSTPPKSIQELENVCKSVSIPVIGIGGITLENAISIVGCGIKGIAVISSFSTADDPQIALKELVKCFTSQ